ncbi:MAG: DUF1858 domain-containing protein [candidate division WOR-3 bacterium]|nr:MAG: DUF1858 domain-containing protein [candidate division WOR-3 bacterium]
MTNIAKDTAISDVLDKFPNLVTVFIDHGLPCLVCGQPFWGTIEELAQKHNIDVAILLEKLNEKKRDIGEKL